MGLRFRKRVTLFPGVKINFGLKGTSLSIGGNGATLNVGKKGARATIGIPGTGISYTEQLRSKNLDTTSNQQQPGKYNKNKVCNSSFILCIILLIVAFFVFTLIVNN